MLPVIVLVGRPNVGKSTLFNRLTRSRNALTGDFPGLTRDRQYGEGRRGACRYIVVDTGGIGESDNTSGGGVAMVMAAQTMSAVDEADVVLFMVDAREGLTVADERIAAGLRQQGKAFSLVMNKCDVVDEDVAAAEFFSLGAGAPLAVSAEHGRGINRLTDQVLASFAGRQDTEEEGITTPALQNEEAETGEEEERISIAVAGRPNTGKSTLVNRLLGEERVVVYDQAGTTRDSIYIPYEREGQRYTLIDTAGVRRRGKVTRVVEKFSVIKTLQAIEKCRVVILLIDAREGVVDQDLQILRYALEAGRSVVIAVNKWDGLAPDQREQVRRSVDRRLMSFAGFIRIHFISALHGSGVGGLYTPVNEAYRSGMQRHNTAKLTTILQQAVAAHQPPLVRGRRIRLRYCHAGGISPPEFVVHGNQTEDVPRAYTRYLENYFRSALSISGTPVRVRFKTGENPFADRKNTLTGRQIKKRQRMMKHVKKAHRKN